MMTNRTLCGFFDGELSLVGTHYLVELRMEVLGKLLGGLLRILYGLLHHLRFHLLKRHVLVLHRIVIAAIDDGHALLEQVVA